jgi:hypothetical protein
MRALGRVAIRLLAVLYLAGLFFDGIGYDAPLRGLPGPLRYAIEVAALFPDAAKSISEYRAEAWMCKEHRWQELDTRKYFWLDPDDKENRFQRALHFYHEEMVVKRAIDVYLTNSHNHRETNSPDDGIPPTSKIGGVRILIVRWPMPKPGDKLIPYSVVPLAKLRPDATKNAFYEPTKADLSARCGEPPAEEASP